VAAQIDKDAAGKSDRDAARMRAMSATIKGRAAKLRG